MGAISGPRATRARSRSATGSPGRDERWGVWGAISGPPTFTIPLLALDAAAAWGDHPGASRSESWSPLTAALVFGGLALLAGMLVILIVTLLTRRSGGSS